jgi:hypothetical protein
MTPKPYMVVVRYHDESQTEPKTRTVFVDAAGSTDAVKSAALLMLEEINQNANIISVFVVPSFDFNIIK